MYIICNYDKFMMYIYTDTIGNNSQFDDLPERGGSINGGTPIAGWFIREHLI